MPTLPVNLIKGDKISSKTDYRDFLPVNMYAVQKNILGANGYLIGVPGIESFATGSGIDRGGIYNERTADHFRVSGGSFISVAKEGSVTNLGSIPGVGQAALPYSFNTQAIIADGRMWLYDSTNGLTEITDADLGNPIDGVWVNGYYFLTDGEYIYHTDTTSETSIDPLKFATAEFMPDKSLGVGKTQDNKVMVFGRYTIEYFIDRAQENFAFQRVESRAQKIGIVATHAKTEASGTWFIVGGRKDESIGVYSVGVGSVEKVSTREVDRILEQYSEPELVDIRVESRTLRDTTFIIISLPDETLCFNVTIAKSLGKSVAWSLLQTGISPGAWNCINGVFDSRSGKWIYADRTNSNIGELTEDTFEQYGEKQEIVFSTPFVSLETASIDEIEIDTIPGNHINDDATLAFSLTYDGQTYSQEWWDLYSEPNNYGTRYIQRRLGYVDESFSLRFRSVTTARMAFAGLKVTYG
jgi:hypothetical protein